ncbi:MAG TPA: hypothetical protein VEL07_06195 [Planctomycetota bacterium]|nr:hypothetical protein [Planctomycetota bacterium]
MALILLAPTSAYGVGVVDAPVGGAPLVMDFNVYKLIARRYEVGAYPGRFVVISVVWVNPSSAGTMGWWGGYNQWAYTLFESNGQILSANGWNGQPPDFAGYEVFQQFCSQVKTSPGWLVDIKAEEYAPRAWMDERLRASGDLDDHPMDSIPAGAGPCASCACP